MIVKEFIFIIILLIIVNLLYQILNGELILLSAFLIVCFFVVSFFEKEIGLNLFQKDTKSDSITALEVIHDSLDEFKNNQAQMIASVPGAGPTVTPPGATPDSSAAVSPDTLGATPGGGAPGADEIVYFYNINIEPINRIIDINLSGLESIAHYISKIDFNNYLLTNSCITLAGTTNTVTVYIDFLSKMLYFDKTPSFKSNQSLQSAVDLVELQNILNGSSGRTNLKQGCSLGVNPFSDITFKVV